MTRNWNKLDPIQYFNSHYSYIKSRSQLQKEDRGLYNKLLKKDKLDVVLPDYIKTDPVKLFKQQYSRVTNRNQLRKENGSLYNKLWKEGKLDEVLPEKLRRDYNKTCPVELFHKKYSYVTSRGQLYKECKGLYLKLWREGRLDEVLPEKREQRDWKKQDPVELFKQQYSHITSRRQLKKQDVGLYSMLLRENRLDEVLLENQNKNHRDWSKTDPVHLFKTQYSHITSRIQLQKEDFGLYRKLLNEGKLDVLLPEKKGYRDYGKTDPAELFKQQYSHVKSRTQLYNEDSGLYAKLLREDRLDVVLPSRDSERAKALEEVVKRIVEE